MRRVDLRALIWRQILFMTAVIGFISCVANQAKDIGNGGNIEDEALDSIIGLCLDIPSAKDIGNGDNIEDEARDSIIGLGLDIPSAKDIFYDTSRGNAIARFRIRFAPTSEERRLFDSIMSSERVFIDSLLSNNILSTVPYPETLILEPTHITSQMYYRTNHRPYDIRKYKWDSYYEFEYPCTGFQLFVKAILESYDRREAMIVIKNLMYMNYTINLIVKKYEIYLGENFADSTYWRPFVLPRVFDKMFKLLEEKGFEVSNPQSDSEYPDNFNYDMMGKLGSVWLYREESGIDTMTYENLMKWTDEPWADAFNSPYIN